MESPMVLGEKINMVYSVSNMQAAANFIQSNSKGNANFDIKATHYYVKFTPQNSEQEESLEAVKANNLLSYYPQDREIVTWGKQQPEINSNGFANLYGIIPVSQIPSDVPYELIDEIYEPQEHEADLTIVSNVLCGNADKLSVRFNDQTLSEENLAEFLAVENRNDRFSYYPEGYVLFYDHDISRDRGVKNLKLYIGNNGINTVVYTDENGYFRSNRAITGIYSVCCKWENKNGSQILKDSWVTLPDGIYGLGNFNYGTPTPHIMVEGFDDGFYRTICIINNAMNEYNDMIGNNTAISHNNSAVKGSVGSLKTVPNIQNTRIWYFSSPTLNYDLIERLYQLHYSSYFKYMGSACTMSNYSKVKEGTIAYIQMIKNHYPFWNDILNMINNSTSNLPDLIYTDYFVGGATNRNYADEISQAARRMAQYSLTKYDRGWDINKDLILAQLDYVNGGDLQLYESYVLSSTNVIESYCSVNQYYMYEQVSNKYNLGPNEYHPMFDNLPCTSPVCVHIEGFLEYGVEQLMTPIMFYLVNDQEKYHGDFPEFTVLNTCDNTTQNPWIEIKFHSDGSLSQRLYKICEIVKNSPQQVTPTYLLDAYNSTITDPAMRVEFLAFIQYLSAYYFLPSIH